MLDFIAEKLKEWPPNEGQPISDAREAAVLVPLTREPEPAMVFTLRSELVSSHRGEVAFPGGMWEEADISLLHTALRETEEEIALPTHEVDVIATMPAKHTRYNVRVTPFVGLFAPDIPLTPEPGELDAVFHVPLQFLLDRHNLSRHVVELADGRRFSTQCYQYQGFRIWGFTLMVLRDFLKQTFVVDFDVHFQELE